MYKNFQKEIDQAHGEANKQFELHYSRIKERVLDMVSKVKFILGGFVIALFLRR